MSETAADKQIQDSRPDPIISDQVEVTTIHSLQEVDESLHTLANLMREVQSIEATAEQAINNITDEKLRAAKPILKRIKRMEKELSRFMEGNKSALFPAEKKSIDLNYGKIGYRESTKIKTTKMTLKLIKSFGYKEAIKTEEKLNREAMKSWSTEKLASVLAQKETKDLPYYETKEFEIKDLN